MKLLRAYALCYPASLLLAFYATFLAARISLGYWPRASLDDPKSIGAWVPLPYTVTWILLMPGALAFAIVVLVMLYRARWDETRQKELVRVSAFSVACMVVAILVLRWDPLGVVLWYMD